MPALCKMSAAKTKNHDCYAAFGRHSVSVASLHLSALQKALELTDRMPRKQVT